MGFNSAFKGLNYGLETEELSSISDNGGGFILFEDFQTDS
jgi:hypothetical protein